MKKTLVLMLAVGLAIGLLAMAGCGSKTTTIKTPEGEVTVDKGGGENEGTITTDEGSVTWKSSDEAPTEEQLGAPAYPGAKYVEGSGGTESATGTGSDLAVANADFTTTDSYDKVVSWYKGKMGEAFFEGSGGEKEAIWMSTKGEKTTTVTVTDEGGEVSIKIGTIQGKMGQ